MGVGPVGADLAVFDATDDLGLGVHQRVDERGGHLPHQVRRGLLELFGQETGRVKWGAVIAFAPSEKT